MYFFKGNSYWCYNEFKGVVDDNYLKLIIVWGKELFFQFIFWYFSV